jgi:hypothetical protein
MAREKKVHACVMLLPHMQRGKGQIHPCLFGILFRIKKSLRKFLYFLREKLGSLERKLPGLGKGIF